MCRPTWPGAGSGGPHEGFSPVWRVRYGQHESETTVIYLIGGSGSPNFGDELMLLHWLRYTAERFGSASASVVVDNNNERNSVNLFGERFPHARFVSLFKRLRHPNQSKDFMENLRYGFGFFTEGTYKSHPQLVEALPALAESRLLHVYGGGYINTSLSPHGAILLGMVADAKRNFGMKLAGTGLGLSPLTFEPGTPTRELAQVVELFDLLEVRDVQSYQQLRRYVGAQPSLVLGHDDSLVYPLQRNPQRTGHRKLHLSAIKSGNMFERPEVIAQVKRNLDRFDELVYWNCAPHLEAPVIEQIHKRFDNVRVAPVEELLFDGPPVDPGDYMLTMRFHPHMVASRLGCSGQFWSGSPYYDHKHGSVNQLGSRFRKHDATVEHFEAVEQPIEWREPGHNLLKQILAARIYAGL